MKYSAMQEMCNEYSLNFIFCTDEPAQESQVSTPDVLLSISHSITYKLSKLAQANRKKIVPTWDLTAEKTFSSRFSDFFCWWLHLPNVFYANYATSGTIHDFTTATTYI